MRKICIWLLILLLCLSGSLAQAETDGDFCYTIEDGKANIIAYTGNASELIIPDTLDGHPVTAINYCAFRGCASLSRITLPDGLVSIGSNAFQNCISLAQIDFPDSLAFIGTHAFYGCAKLTQITLPESIMRLHPYAFYGCPAARRCSHRSQAALVLSDFGYSFVSPDYPQLSLMAYEDKTGRRTFTVTDCDESAVHVAFPDGVTLIDGYAFFNCASLTEITIPDGVIEVAYSAFEDCSALTQVTFPGSVAKIAESAFSGCQNITFIAPEGSAAQMFVNSNAENDFSWHAL